MDSLTWVGESVSVLNELKIFRIYCNIASRNTEIKNLKNSKAKKIPLAG